MIYMFDGYESLKQLKKDFSDFKKLEMKFDNFIIIKKDQLQLIFYIKYN